MKPWEIMRLTDRQIVELYYHPREEDGSIKPVQTVENREPRTVEEALIQFQSLAQQLRMPAEKIAEGVEKIRVKWADADKA